MNLQGSHPNPFPTITLRSFYAALIAFLAYSAVYAFRKPFTIASFDGLHFFGVSYQTLLIISQVLGYMLSKFYGIKFISALKPVGRWKTISVLIGISWVCLLFFAMLPPPLGMLMLFLNGFMLGFMWGIIFSYIEGRTATDFIGTVMAISFIFAGGFTRSVARWVSIYWQVNDFWMPFITGLVFVIPLAILIYLLEKLPVPDQNDRNQRSERTPMDDTSLRIPEMGWNHVRVARPTPLLAGFEVTPRFYFAHSYHMVCTDPADAVGVTTYGYEFPSVVVHDNVMGAQFHPEKSHRFGIKIFENFLAV